MGKNGKKNKNKNKCDFRVQNCYGCGDNIPTGSLCVSAPKFGEQTAWHPACFQCNACNELLVDLTYCVHDDQLYCERHYAEQLKPRCSACDEVHAPPIFPVFLTFFKPYFFFFFFFFQIFNFWNIWRRASIWRR